MEANAHTYDFTLWPETWEAVDKRFKFKWKYKKFNKSSQMNIPDKPGVYTFIVRPQIANHPACSFLVYAGKASSLKKRFGQYLSVQKGTRLHSPKVEQGLEQYAECNNLFFYYSRHSRGSIENHEKVLINGFIPPWNDKKTISSSVGNIVRAFR